MVRDEGLEFDTRLICGIHDYKQFFDLQVFQPFFLLFFIDNYTLLYAETDTKTDTKVQPAFEFIK